MPDSNALTQRLQAIPNKGNREAARSYFTERAQRVKPQTLLSMADPIVALGQRLGKRPWKALQREDIIAAIGEHAFARGAHNTTRTLPTRNLAASTKYQWCIHLRRFYKWVLGTRQLPTKFDDLPFKKMDAMKERGRELALTPLEVRKLLGGAQNPRDRALLLLLIETGFRVSEAAALRLDLMEERKHGYWFCLPKKDDPDAIRLKTGAREVAVPLILSAKQFKAWLDVHPRFHEARAPVFVNLSNRSPGTRMSGKSISDVVARCARRAGLDKVHAHMMRHTSATLKTLRGMAPEAIRLIHGWSRLSTMPTYYTHMRPHFEGLVLQTHGLEDDEDGVVDIMGSQRCLLCGAKNKITDVVCSNCDSRLAASAQEAERQHRDGLLLDHVIHGAIQSLQDDLIMAVARAMGFEEATV